MSTTSSVIASLCAMGLAWMSFSALGCGRPGIRDVCMAACECVNDAPCEADSETVEVCIEYSEAQRKASIDLGCGAEFDDKTACYGTGYQCPTPSDFCKEEQVAYDACVAPPG